MHSWIDAPYKWLGRRHRILRHTPAEVIARYGLSEQALSGLLHIAADRGVSQLKKRNKTARRKRRSRR